MCYVALDQPLGNVGSFYSNIFLNKRLPDVTLNLVNFRLKFFLFSFQVLQFVQFFLYPILGIS